MKRKVARMVAVAAVTAGLIGCSENPTSRTVISGPGKYLILGERTAEIRVVSHDGSQISYAGVRDIGNTIRFDVCGLALTNSYSADEIDLVFAMPRSNCHLQQHSTYTLLAIK